MNYEEARKEWVKALRSGEYEQCQSYLSLREGDKTGYCCLGVACEVYNKLNPENQVEKTSRDLFASNILNVIKEDGHISLYDNECYCLPKKVAEWLNVTTDGDFKRAVVSDDSSQYWSLIAVNDSGFMFTTIANIIEQDHLESVS